MRKIKKVKITGFWGDKSVTLDFNDEINFLIGLNGSGKTTMINLIAAALKADFGTLDKFQYEKIRIDFFPLNKTDKSFIEVEKIDKDDSPYPSIIFKIKTSAKDKIKTFNLNELEEEQLFRYPKDYIVHKRRLRSGQVARDIHIALRDFVNLTWLSIHRKNNFNKNEDSYDSTIDQKVKELSSDLVKYFGILDKSYSSETEKFQKNIFLSLIKDDSKEDVLSISNELDSDKEKESLKQIFLLFGLKEKEFSDKLDLHFQNFETATEKLESKESSIGLNDLASLIGTRRIHTIVQEWNSLNRKKSEINKPKFTFIEIINSLFQRKQVFINERNELLVQTQSNKIFPLTRLSSGEKQLLIILGQSLLQENRSHIYIADEPELSLHVEWQEKLVTSLRNINPNSQIIFATHSPDIVGNFSKSVIQVEKVIK
ncbi:ATP-binding protein [Seonamhaeicola sp. MEBiC1930]|uniref:AAA family ATPase n=1 Tax=Seonamhaeicola sp. MEBiC01930 TaxID=2976768 RepID=UPI0032491AF6